MVLGAVLLGKNERPVALTAYGEFIKRMPVEPEAEVVRGWIAKLER